METRPSIMVTEHDLARLQQCVADGYDSLADVAVEALYEELGRARVITASDTPPTLVTMNSRVVVENVSTSRKREVTLAYPRDTDAARGRISVFSPLGAALLGLSQSQEIAWKLPNGRPARFRIEEILYQPEAAGDYHL
jgi:regulator of nucleoside diphosphate kinase